MPLSDHQYELLLKALRIMEKRAIEEGRSVDSALTYNSCICMICYALDENEECLNQFDY